MIGEDPDSPDVFDETGIEQIRDSINDAIEEIVFITGSNRRTFRLPLVQDQMFYRISLASGDFAWVTDAILVNQRRRMRQTDMVRLEAENPRWMTSTGTPDSYFQVGHNVIGIYRRPASTSDIVNISCVVIPKAYTSDTDRIRLPEAFQRAAMHYAISEYWASRGDAKEAYKSFDKYLTVLGLKENRPDGADHRPFMRTQKRDDSASSG